MLDLTVTARGGRWVLLDDEDELGSFASRAEAMAAADDFVRVAWEPRVVLVCDEAGEWDVAVVCPTLFH